MVLFGQEMCEVAWFLIKKTKAYTQQATNHVTLLAKEGIVKLGSSSARSPDTHRKNTKSAVDGTVSVAIRVEPAAAGDAVVATSVSATSPSAAADHPLGVQQSPTSTVELTSGPQSDQ
jgi:hypothetical protein